MNKQVKFIAQYGDTTKSLVWISLQQNGSISIGISDRTFISPRFRARNYIFNAYNRRHISFLIPSEHNGLETVKNPHLTFHPPIMFHYRANGDEILFEGIADVNVVLAQEPIFPWIRFVSGPFEELQAANTRSGEKIISEQIAVPIVECSLGLGLDLLRSPNIDYPNHYYHSLIEWNGYNLLVFGDILSPRKSTLSWFYQY